MLTNVIMSANSSLSAAKRRRGGTQLDPPSKSNMVGNDVKPPPRMPHPLDILKSHELRIRELEGLIMENKQIINDLEKTNIYLTKQNENILNKLMLVEKNQRSNGADSLSPTFSSVNISSEHKIKGSIQEEGSDTDSSNEN